MTLDTGSGPDDVDHPVAAISVMLSVLVVDDDATTRETLTDFLVSCGHVVRSAATAATARRMAAEHSSDVAVVDLRLPETDVVPLIESLVADDSELSLIVLIDRADGSNAVRAMRFGAMDLLQRPVELELLRAAVERAAERGRLRRELAHLRKRDADVAASSAVWTPPSLDKLIDLAARNADVPVLILGEPGTGKSIVARRIHHHSSRALAPFVVVDCASRSPVLLDGELFGHERGAFADAGVATRGLLEVAGSGTVLLEDVAELAPVVQPKLLTAIEDGVFHRVGGMTALRSEARILAATNASLRSAVDTGRFRPDLFYRLQVLTIEIAPLRERRPEISGLANALLPRGARLSDHGRRSIESYDWPGNVRELKHALWRASILARGSPILPVHLALDSSRSATSASPHLDRAASAESGVATMADAEREAIVAALHATGGNKVRAAQLLGIARSTLLEKVRRFSLG